MFVCGENWARIPYDLYPVSNPDWYSDHSSGWTIWVFTASTHLVGLALVGTGGMGVPGNGLHVRTHGGPDMHTLAYLGGLFPLCLSLTHTNAHAWTCGDA